MHNAAEYVLPVLRALRDLQGPEPIEVVAINDHSADKTLDMLREHADLLPELRILEADARGVAAARNQAVQSARGDYLWFADCDDLWDPAIVAEMLAAADDSDADVVLCNASKVTADGAGLGLILDAPESGRIEGTETLGRLMRGEVQGHLWNKLIRRHLLEDRTFPATRAHSDLGGLISILSRAERVTLLPRTLYRYVIHSGSILNKREYQWEDLDACLDLATKAASNGGVRRTDLLCFKYRNVVIPLENEAIRRRGWEPGSGLAKIRRRNRARISPREIARLVVDGRIGLAARAAAIKYAPATYGRLYSRHRRKAWSNVDDV